MNVAIIGSGRMGKIRAAAAKSLGAQVVAVCDPDLNRAVALTEELGEGEAVETASRIDWSSIDAAFICTPPSSRREAELAVNARVNTMIEKPIALSASAARTLLQCADIKSVVTAVGFMNRYRTSVRSLKEKTQSQIPLGIAFQWAGGRYHVPWWSDPARSGGPIVEQCTHIFDLCRYICGEVDSVHALGQANTLAVDADLVAISLRFCSGVLGTILYTCRADEKQISLSVVTNSCEHRLTGWDFHDACSGTRENDRNEIFRNEVEAFFNDISGASRKQVLSDFRDAAKTQAVVDAALQSISTGQIATVKA